MYSVKLLQIEGSPSQIDDQENLWPSTKTSKMEEKKKLDLRSLKDCQNEDGEIIWLSFFWNTSFWLSYSLLLLSSVG